MRKPKFKVWWSRYPVQDTEKDCPLPSQRSMTPEESANLAAYRKTKFKRVPAQHDELRDAIDAWENMTVQEGELAFSMLKRLPRLVAAHDDALRASVREECANAAMEAFGHNETNLPHSDGCIACAVKQAILALASEKAAPEDVSHRLTWREELEYSHDVRSEGVEQLRETLKQARRQAAPKEPR